MSPEPAGPLFFSLFKLIEINVEKANLFSLSPFLTYEVEDIKISQTLMSQFPLSQASSLWHVFFDPRSLTFPFTESLTYVHMCVPVRVYAHLMCEGVCRGGKRSSRSPGLELQAFVSYLIWVLGTEPRLQQEQHLLLPLRRASASLKSLNIPGCFSALTVGDCSSGHGQETGCDFHPLKCKHCLMTQHMKDAGRQSMCT